MMRWFSVSRIVALAVATVAVLFLAGWLTREDPAEKPYLRIAGSGFLFNYRIAEVSYGFSVEVLKPLPTGTIIEATFEDPSGGADLVVRRRVSPETARYGFQSPAVRNVEARRPYRIEIVVFDREEKTEIWRHRFTVASQIGDEVMPERALTIGPGYTPNLQR